MLWITEAYGQAYGQAYGPRSGLFWTMCFLDGMLTIEGCAFEEYACVPPRAVAGCAQEVSACAPRGCMRAMCMPRRAGRLAGGGTSSCEMRPHPMRLHTERDGAWRAGRMCPCDTMCDADAHDDSPYVPAQQEAQLYRPDFVVLPTVIVRAQHVSGHVVFWSVNNDIGYQHTTVNSRVSAHGRVPRVPGLKICRCRLRARRRCAGGPL